MPPARRGRGAACVQLGTVLLDLYSLSQLMKGCARAGTGVDSAGADVEIEKLP